MQTNRFIACGACHAQNRVQPAASRFTCTTCGAMNTISDEQRRTASRNSVIFSVIGLVIAIAFTIWVLQTCSQAGAL